MLTELPLKAITPELKVIIENYPKCIHWYELITKFEIPLDIIKKYNAPDQFSGNEEFFWKRYTMYQTIKDVRNFINVIWPYMLPWVWAYIFQYQVLDEDFIDKSLENLKIDPDIEKYWGYVSQHQKLSIKFIEDHYDKVNWGYLACEPFPEDFIVKYLTGDNVHESRAFAGYRDTLLKFQSLSYKTIHKYFNDFNFNETLAYNPNLSSDIIDQINIDEKGWKNISTHRKLDVPFVLRYIDKLSVSDLCSNHSLSKEIIDIVLEKCGYLDVTALYFHNKELFKTIAPLLTKEQLMKILIKKVE